MTKLPQTISKYISVFSGEEVSDNCKRTASFIMTGRRSGRTTSLLLRGLGIAVESRDGAIVVDHHTTTMRQAEHNAAIAREIISALGFGGYKVTVKRFSDLIGIFPIVVGSVSEPDLFCVHIEFYPIVEVHYDLRK